MQMKLLKRTSYPPVNSRWPLSPWSSRCCPKCFLRRKSLTVSTTISSSEIFVFFNIQSLINNNCSFRRQNLRESKTKCWRETDERSLHRGEMSRDGALSSTRQQTRINRHPASALQSPLSFAYRSLIHDDDGMHMTPSLISLIHDT